MHFHSLRSESDASGTVRIVQESQSDIRRTPWVVSLYILVICCCVTDRTQILQHEIIMNFYLPHFLWVRIQEQLGRVLVALVPYAVELAFEMLLAGTVVTRRLY